MKIEDFQQFQIEADTRDPLVLSLALASRGVLEADVGMQAMGQSVRQWRDTIARAVEGHGLARWQMPMEATVGATMSASRLADAWREAAGKGQTDAVRLALVSAKNGGYEGGLIGKTVRSLSRAAATDGSNIASVVIPTNAAFVEATGWPLRIGVYPDEAGLETARRLSASRYVRRGLAHVAVLNADAPECDVLIAPHDLRSMSRDLRSRGFVPRAKVVVGQELGLQNRVQRHAALSFLNERVGAAVVGMGLPSASFNQQWLDAFIASLSHRNTYDVALWEAARSLNATSSNLPWIAADPGFLAASRLDNFRMTLADRIEAVGGNFTLGGDTADRLRMSPGTHSAPDIAGMLRERLDSDSYLHEGDAATGDAELSQETSYREAQLAEKTTDPGTNPHEERPLFADVTFFDSETGRRIDDTLETLVLDQEVKLEVTFRAVPQGISYRGQAPQQSIAPVDPADDATLLVVLTAVESDFDIPEPVQRMRFTDAPGAEPRPVEFLIKPKRLTDSPSDLVAVEVRIYYELNLLEYLEIKAEVVRRLPATPTMNLPVPIFLEQRQGAARTRAELVKGLRPQRLAIDLGRVDQLMRFTFTLALPPNGGQRSIVLNGRKEIDLAMLRQELGDLRAKWEEIAVDAFARTVQGGQVDFAEALKALATKGRELWSVLFRTGSKDGAMWAIGSWLQAHRPAEGAPVDVKLRDGAESFIFPWSTLYDVDRGGNDDPTGFWGVRYCIGQSARGWPGSTKSSFSGVGKPTNMEFMTWNSFDNIAEQRALLNRLAAESAGRFVVDTNAPISNEPKFLRMLAACDADILYFYTHGFTRPAESDAFDPVADRVRKAFEALPPDERASSGLKALYDVITSDDYKVDQSWIRLSGGRLILAKLMPVDEISLQREPVVILNMCQSAQVMPGLQYSFVQFFLHRRARSVIGTECPISTVFAHPFSERLLREFLGGCTLGEALRRARAHFMQQRNPLGLAYTLFGAAGAQFQAPVVPAAAASVPPPTIGDFE